MWSQDVRVHTGLYTDTLTLSLSCKQTVFIHLGGPNRLCLSFECMMQRRQCDMLLWKHSGMSLAAVLGAFHHIQYNNKHNNVGGEREYFKKDQIAPKLMSVRSTWQRLCRFECTSLPVKNKGLMRGKYIKKTLQPAEVEVLLFSCSSHFVLLPLPSTAYWPWPPCNVWCLHCHNSSQPSAEYVSIACWCVLRWGKVSGGGGGGMEAVWR